MLAQTRPETAPHRLLAIRHAGAPFDDAHTLRNHPFERVLEKRDALRAELHLLRESLVEALYETVPKVPHAEGRRRLLKLKRNIYNDRPIGPSSEAAPPAELPTELHADVSRYGVLREQLDGLLDNARDAVLAASRERLAALRQDERFRLALHSASPDLDAELRRGLPQPAEGFSTAERALYSYAARFFSKANPFHLFAAVQLPEQDAPGEEICLEPEGLLALEARLLAGAFSEGAMPESLVRLALPPFARHGERYLFWSADHEGLRVGAVTRTEELETLLDFFIDNRRQGRATASLERWRRHLEELPAGRRRGVEQARLQLEREGLLRRYLITDFTELGPLAEAVRDSGSESGVDPATSRAVREAQRVHLARVSDAELATEQDRLAQAGLRHHVNSYRSEDPAPHHEAAAAVAGDLRDLKAVFLAFGHNFSLHDSVMRAYAADYLGQRGGAAPFLEILTHFLGHKGEILQSFQPERRAAAADALRRAALWRERAAAEDGELGQVALRRLVETAPLHRGGELCFNGPWDFASGLFTVSNVFDGGGHFAARYQLHRHRDARTRRPARDGVLDVELAPPPVPALNFVVPAFATGTGMEARYSHRFERWIPPEEIEFALEAAHGEDSSEANSEVVYRHAPSGRRLRFHYRGFMLAHQLPAEYQLLLLGHGDTWGNPFLRSEGRPGPGELRHDPELRYGRVRLRRECWALSHSLLASAPRQEDALVFAVELRDWLHATLGVEADCWYYRTLGGDGRGYKPRFLDLRNPLSAFAFRRSLLAVPKTAALSFTVLDPSPEGLLDGRMRELMIEV